MSRETKFINMIKYLENCNEKYLLLSFEEIENIIGFKLCDSAYKYKVYWNPSGHKSIANVIFDSGFKVKNVDLNLKQLELEKIF